MPISLPLDPSKIYSGEWETYSYGDWESNWVDYDNDTLVDYNGDRVNYGSYGSLGLWYDSESDGYQGFYWSHDYDFEYKSLFFLNH